MVDWQGTGGGVMLIHALNSPKYFPHDDREAHYQAWRFALHAWHVGPLGGQVLIRSGVPSAWTLHRHGWRWEWCQYSRGLLCSWGESCHEPPTFGGGSIEWSERPDGWRVPYPLTSAGEALARGWCPSLHGIDESGRRREEGEAHG